MGPHLPSPIRILVVGTSSTGKTMYASRLSKILDVPRIELDELYWSHDWKPKPKAEFVRLVEHAATQPDWIVDGNYSAVREQLWSKATLIIWLNYSLTLSLWRGFKRTLVRCITRQALWHGNRETFRQTFFSKQSILVWIVTTHQRRRTEFATIRNSQQFPAVSWLEFRHPSQAEQWLQRLHGAA
jgi:adenylate kinase family enzyme